MVSQIKLNSVTQRFLMNKSAVTLFENITFNLIKGESLSIVGPSGAGKSSLLLLMAGLEIPSSGEVIYSRQGEVVALDRLRQQCGFVFQQFHLLPELNALDNVALPLKIKGDGQALDKARDWLEKVGLANRSHHKPNQLSGGEQQRVAIARAFINQPDFVFADEPTGNLDKRTANEIIELMFNCASLSNSSLVYVTHNEGFASLAKHKLSLTSEPLQNSVSSILEAG